LTSLINTEQKGTYRGGVQFALTFFNYIALLWHCAYATQNLQNRLAECKRKSTNPR